MVVRNHGIGGMPDVWSRYMPVLFDKFDFVVGYLDDICIFATKKRGTHDTFVCGILSAWT